MKNGERMAMIPEPKKRRLLLKENKMHDGKEDPERSEEVTGSALGRME